MVLDEDVHVASKPNAEMDHRLHMLPRSQTISEILASLPGFSGKVSLPHKHSVLARIVFARVWNSANLESPKFTHVFISAHAITEFGHSVWIRILYFPHRACRIRIWIIYLPNSPHLALVFIFAHAISKFGNSPSSSCIPYPNSDTLPSNLPLLSAGASRMPYPNLDTLPSNLPPLSAGASCMPYPNSDTLPSNLPSLSSGASSCCKQPRHLSKSNVGAWTWCNFSKPFFFFFFFFRVSLKSFLNLHATRVFYTGEIPAQTSIRKMSLRWLGLGHISTGPGTAFSTYGRFL